MLNTQRELMENHRLELAEPETEVEQMNAAPGFQSTHFLQKKICDPNY